MSKTREWMPVEYEVVSKMHAVGKSDVEIAAMLNRGDREIRKARQRLGLATRATPNGKAWPIGELKKLHEMFEAGMKDDAIAEVLGRPEGSIRAKREVLGLRRQKQPARTQAAMIGLRPDPAQLLAMRPLSPSVKDKTTRQYANTAFLIQLLRAGHVPGQGELSIEHDARALAKVSGALGFSPIGSSAAACLG